MLKKRLKRLNHNQYHRISLRSCKNKKKSFLKLVTELACIFGIIGVFFYFIRISIKHIPFFLDGLYNFKFSILKELSGGIIITYILFTTQIQLKQMVTELHTRIYSYI